MTNHAETSHDQNRLTYAWATLLPPWLRRGLPIASRSQWLWVLEVLGSQP